MHVHVHVHASCDYWWAWQLSPRLSVPPAPPPPAPTVTLSQSKCRACEVKMIIANLRSLMTAPGKKKAKSDVLGSIPASHNLKKQNPILSKH